MINTFQSYHPPLELRFYSLSHGDTPPRIADSNVPRMGTVGRVGKVQDSLETRYSSCAAVSSTTRLGIHSSSPGPYPFHQILPTFSSTPLIQYSLGHMFFPSICQHHRSIAREFPSWEQCLIIRHIALELELRRVGRDSMERSVSMITHTRLPRFDILDSNFFGIMMDLPQELPDKHIGHLPPDDKRSLRNFSLVAQSWIRFSQRRLFTSVFICLGNLLSWMNRISPTNTKLLAMGHVRVLSYDAVGPTHHTRDYFPSFRRLRSLRLSFTHTPLLSQQIESFSAFQHTLVPFLDLSLRNRPFPHLSPHTTWGAIGTEVAI